MRGKVIIVGGGPGDPKLITVKGLEALASADVIIYDRLAPKELLARAKSDCEIIYAGKGPGDHALEQDEINQLMVKKAIEGKVVVRLKGGDPYTFGRGEEECEYVISHGVPCEVVPGVPSFVGSSAYAGIPLAGRGFASSFAVITGHLAGSKDFDAYLERIKAIAASVDMIVILMGVSNLDKVLTAIAEVKGPGTYAAAVMNATLQGQLTVCGRITDVVEAWRRGLIKNPAVIYVGAGVKLRERLWRTGAELCT